MLAFEIALLTGRYVATAFNDRGAAEWPPHPARLFSALVAAHFEALDPPANERAALEWLEAQGAPEIVAPEASGREVATVFVPVNDTGVVGSLDSETAAVSEARRDLETARAKGAKALAAAEKKLAKAEAKLSEAARRATAAGGESKAAVTEAAQVLPERRKRQPRTFPSAAPADLAGEARFFLYWPGAEPPPDVRDTLDTLSARVVRLGHSSSLVRVRLIEQPPPAGDDAGIRWVPDDTAPAAGRDVHTLRVVGAGQLAALCAAYAVQLDAPGRVLPARFQRYVRPRPHAEGAAAQSVFGDDWIVLRRVDPPEGRSPRLPITRTVDVGRTVRKALMAALGEGVPEILSGHDASGKALDRSHVAYVPLPFVGHDRADGSILGIALILPQDATPDDRRAVLRALDAWESWRPQKDQDGDDLAVPVYLGKAGILWLMRQDEEAVQSTLRSETWCAESCSWVSATPVALDRNPGDLRANDPTKEAAAYAEAEETIAVACTRIGLPRPVQVTATLAAPLAGAEKARLFPPFIAGKPPVQRVLVHAKLMFGEPVRGPILLGAGRYFGLGLFRPRRES
jgi:CRISPR-associated protein Csb2